MAFVKVFQKAAQFRGEARFKTWLFQIAVNECKNFYRGRERQRIDDVELEMLPEPDDCALEERAGTAEEQRLLRSAVARLPEKQRITLQLRLYKDLTFGEIAATMGCPVGTAKANFHHALNGIRKLLRPENLGDEDGL
jgi:RNA polymerase sigma-70 factor (ECF subfamily)